MRIETLDISLPHLPASLEGLRIAHLTDLHVRRPRGRHRLLLKAMDALEADLTLLTGDYMCDPGDEPAAMNVLREVCRRIRSPLGAFGVLGNHDTHVMRAMADELPVRWLDNECVRLAGQPIEVMGFVNQKHRRPDVLALVEAMERAGPAVPAMGVPVRHDVAAARSEPVDQRLVQQRPRPAQPAQPDRPLRLLLSHYPTMLPVASELGVHLMFSGHTHGGQWRLPGRLAPYTSCDLPSGLCAGILRHRQTLCAVARGIGETFVPLRILCPPHLPVYVLHRGPLPGAPTPHMENVRPW
jgi:predicted MPP superfamily phosphohydrolase